ncbi:MAG: helix-turn-helix domain-containing protein [Gemmatimonadetes bacterium]|nr:helix-turn-helix domain-containing protein [Gemmatimonadota bacterium]
MIGYTEIEASPALTSEVECFWTVRGGTTDGQYLAHRVLPDTCIDLVFQLSDAPIWVSGPAHGFRSFIVGTMTSALRLVHTGEIDLMGVRFRAGRASAFLPAPASAFTDSYVDLRDAWAGTGDLADELSALDTRRRVAVIERVLLRRLSTRAERWDRDPLVDEGLARRRATGGRLAMRDLRRSLETTERTLERRFSAAIGIAPKVVARVMRLQAATAAILSRRDGLARIATATGFADQSHMNREFNALAGT